MTDALGFTPRQAEVLRGLLQGKCDKAIHLDTGMSIGTVKVHAGKVFDKLGARTRQEAIVRFAEKAGFDLVGKFDAMRDGR